MRWQEQHEQHNSGVTTPQQSDCEFGSECRGTQTHRHRHTPSLTHTYTHTYTYTHTNRDSSHGSRALTIHQFQSGVNRNTLVEIEEEVWHVSAKANIDANSELDVCRGTGHGSIDVDTHAGITARNTETQTWNLHNHQCERQVDGALSLTLALAN
jgi:hypothetical protein